MTTPAEQNAAVEAPDEEEADRLRFSEQAALMLNVDKIVKSQISNKPDFPTRLEQTYKNFAKFKSANTGSNGHLLLTNALYRNESIQYLFSEVGNSLLSSILPNIELYKVFYPVSKQEGFLWRIPFDDVPVAYGETTSQFVATSLDELIKGTGRMHGVGIKSFKYAFVGTNPAEVNTNIEAELELYFQDVRDLIKTITFDKNDGNFTNRPSADITIKDEKGADKTIPYSFSYADLVTDTSTVNVKNPLDPNPEYFRLQVVMGYAEPPSEILESITPDMKDIVLKAIRSAKVILYLNPHNHDISFEDNGSVTLKIQYIAAMTSILQSIDGLAISTQHIQVQNAQKEFDENAFSQKESIENIKQNCSINEEARKKAIESKQAEIDAFLAEKQAELENDKNLLYSSVFKILLGLERLGNLGTGVVGPEPGIYSATFSKYALGISPSWWPRGDDVLKDPSQLRILKLNADNGTRGIEDYKLDSLTDDDIKYLPLASTPERSGVVKKGFFSFTGYGDVDPEETKKQAREKLKTKIEGSKRDSIQSDSKGRYPVKFLFLGDIIDIFSSPINQLGVSDRPRIILSDFTIEIPNSPSGNLAQGLEKVDSVYNTDANYEKFTLNIADIPISLNMFQNFFLEKVIKPGRLNYPLVSIINDILTDVVIPAVSPSVFGRKTVLNKAIRVSTLPVTIPLKNGPPLLDPVSNRAANEPFNGVLRDDILNTLKIHDTSMQNIGNPIANYFIIYCSNQLPDAIKGAKGDIVEDAKNGVFHFFVGADKGLIKKINFSRTNTEFYKEAKAQSSTGDKNLGRLREVYDASITMFGNNVYRPGDYIYIEPLFFVGTEAVDLQKKIGLGGYYQVIDSTLTLNENNFETAMKTVLIGYIDDKGNVQEAGQPAKGC